MSSTEVSENDTTTDEVAAAVSVSESTSDDAASQSLSAFLEELQPQQAELDLSEEEELSINNAEGVEFLRALDYALIRYITFSSRLLLVEKPETWQEFHASNNENFEKYGIYTADELCTDFIDEVLPKIDHYELSDNESKALHLLTLHAGFRKVANGYQRLSKQERVEACREPKLNVDYRVEMETFQPRVSPRNDSSANVPQKEQTLHTVIMPWRRQAQQGGYGYQFSEETHALLSAALSDDFELSGCVLHEPKELHQRLRTAKRNFDRAAKMPKNCLSAKELLGKIQKLSELRQTLASMMDRKFT